ncbi:sodium/potassium-transporting ATPase subunit alpha [Drosophila innubila]|uniref:sodium/potassium-transporting ATPase subunit alpha n=1 Tax=Drosophila innubila TaxID=198719 RepID=UPI00148B81D4|nr:sodium/potassium-transporting ATPase subunit alpha [Drosophila innubila]
MADKKFYIHTWPTERICAKFKSDLTNGLTTPTARSRLAANGKNRFTFPVKPESKLRRFMKNCFHAFGLATLLSSISCLFLYNLDVADDRKIVPEYCISGVVLLAAFLISGYLRYLQENNDYKVVGAFKNLMPMYCTVLRDGRKQIIRSENVVLGDILMITYGERIAADVRIFFSNNLELNNVALTGISVPVVISPEVTHVNKWVARNVGFACSHVMKGHGMGIVIACGNDSEVGVMARLSMGTRPTSRARIHIKQVRIYTIILCAIMLFGLFITVSMKSKFEKMWIEYNVGVAVALVPLHLPVLVYFGLWHTRKKLLGMGCYVRNMEAASTLGKTTVICSSLIGTLTMKEWRVSEVFVDGELLRAKEIDVENLSSSFEKLIQISVLCNDASVSPGQRGVPKMLKTLYGSSFDKAVYRFAMSIIPDIQHVRHNHELLTYQTYNSMDQIHVTIHKKVNHIGLIKYLLLIRGHFSVVLNNCTTYFIDREIVPLNETHRDTIRNEALKLMMTGRQSYVFAYKVLSQEEHTLIAGLTYDFNVKNSESFRNRLPEIAHSLHFLGMIAIYDPPVYNINQAVEKCRSAGIKLVLFTRSDVNFSRAIAKTVGIIGPDHETVEDIALRLKIPESQVKRSMITAAVINMRNWHKKLHHQRWDTKQLLLSHPDVVFAEIAVEQRHMIVEVCQELGAVVTVIGSTVHDTCAIRRANIGVAEGASSEASQSCADIILVSSNFVTLVAAIEESRLLYENMKKALAYSLSSNTAIVLIHIAFLVMQIPFRLFLVVYLLLDIFVSMVPALSLFYEPAEENLMRQKPKISDDYVLNKRLVFIAFIQVGVIEANVVFITYFVFMAYNGFLPRMLIGMRQDWYDNFNNDIVDSYGQEWTRYARQQLEYQVSTVTLLTLIIMQCANLILIKTGRANLLSHGFKNACLNIAVFYLIGLGILLSFLNIPEYLRISSVFCPSLFLYIVPSLILLIVLESARRYLLRRFPDSWLEHETYYG